MARWELASRPTVEHRVFGLDRRLLLPTLAVYLVVVLWAGVLPAIDEAVDADEIAPGTIYDIGPARFTPTAGWILAVPPSPVGQSTAATVFKDGVSFTVKGGLWDGSAEELLTRVADDRNDFTVDGPSRTFTSSQGFDGVTRAINGTNFTGLLMAIVDGEGAGVEVTVTGPADVLHQQTEHVGQMIASIVFETAGGTE